MKQNDFPPGWDEQRVRRVLAHYEEQTEAEAVAEDEAARRPKQIEPTAPRFPAFEVPAGARMIPASRAQKALAEDGIV
ncbi:MAG TPA: hypothetical protein DD490_28195 [Acidobacteria bacterium]|nr:hypothetical protein [Acidobacteriota bacterium]